MIIAYQSGVRVDFSGSSSGTGLGQTAFLGLSGGRRDEAAFEIYMPLRSDLLLISMEPTDQNKF